MTNANERWRSAGTSAWPKITSIIRVRTGSPALPLMSQSPSTPSTATSVGEAAELLVTLFELGREVTSVLDLDELLEKIPQLISRLTPFKAFSVWCSTRSRRI